MMFVFLIVCGIGVVRMFVPIAGGPPRIGLWVLVTGAVVVGFEWWVYQAISANLRGGQDTGRRRHQVGAVIEPLIPIAPLFVMSLLEVIDGFTLLVSPAYAMLFVIIGLSVLRLNPSITALCGGVATFGYAALVAIVLIKTGDSASPHPRLMYVNLAVLLAMCAVSTFFVSRRVRRYVVLAVREIQTRRERDLLRRELEVASEIQRRLLPPHKPSFSSLDFAAMSRPAAQAGGDYYDWQGLDDGRLLITLADVTGHGIGPALVTAACRAYVRATADGQRDALDIIGRVNTLLHSDLSDEQFITFAMIELNPHQRKGRFLSAGHGPNFFVRAHDDEVQVIGSQGLPLGVLAEQPIEEVVEFEFGVGDAVVLASDGFFERRNADGKQFGVARLVETIHNHRRDSAERLVAAIDEAVIGFAGDRAQKDDMTAVVVRCIQ